MIDENAFVRYLKWRRRFVLRLTLFHFALILLFDLAAVFLPGLMAGPIRDGSPFNFGLVFAIGIVFSVILSTFYYSHRINREESGRRSR